MEVDQQGQIMMALLLGIFTFSWGMIFTDFKLIDWLQKRRMLNDG